ncbi:MAG TPA: ABC transporter ATP-binding protein, partial [Thermodesulfovibrionales bacterium]|nr:ABC transporter ATP-binding protein [Thermodesulfovibrionales bacterium]
SALIHDPPALIIDEPFVGLDPFGVRMLKTVILGLRAEGVSIFLATHSLHIAEELCDRVGLISKGHLAGLRTKEELVKEGGLEDLFIRMTS